LRKLISEIIDTSLPFSRCSVCTIDIIHLLVRRASWGRMFCCASLVIQQHLNQRRGTSVHTQYKQQHALHSLCTGRARRWCTLFFINAAQHISAISSNSTQKNLDVAISVLLQPTQLLSRGHGPSSWEARLLRLRSK